LVVAAHAKLCRRNAGGWADFALVVAIEAPNTVVTDVVSVVELDGLLEGDSHVALVGRPHPRHQKRRNAEHHEQYARKNKPECGVTPSR
jgi:hypothetical protein